MRIAQKRVGIIASLAVVALAAAGCGSSDAPAASSTPTSAASSAAPSAADTAMSSAADDTSVDAGETSADAGSSEEAPAGSGSGDPKTATSAADFGGLAGLEAAAKEEGALNVIALPPDWANYGEVIAAFEAKYPEITVNQQQPNASSADEIAAAETNKGTDAAPDVFDLGTSVTLSSLDKFAPYQVEAWDSIPDVNKEPTGLWVNDYTGTMAIGYDATTYGEITDIQQLLEPKFAGVVALNGNPNEAGAAFNGVIMTALATGGSLDDISTAVDFWVQVKEAGNFYPGDAQPATIQSGEVGVDIDWSYNMPGYTKALEAEGIEWKVFVPEGAALGSYYNQAVNADAPHPAAARLWEEFLFSPEAQNLWLKGGANPVLQTAMIEDGTIDQAALDALPSDEPPVVQTPEQIKAAADYLKENWSKVTG